MVGRQDDPPEDVKSAGVSQFEGARLRIGFMWDYFFTHSGISSDLQLRLITNVLMRFKNSANVIDNQSRRVRMGKKNKQRRADSLEFKNLNWKVTQIVGFNWTTPLVMPVFAGRKTARLSCGSLDLDCFFASALFLQLKEKAKMVQSHIAKNPTDLQHADPTWCL